MVNTIQTNIYKITLLLFLAFCLGGASKLYAAQNDEVDDKKEDMPDAAQDTSPNDVDNEVGGGTAIEWNDKHQVDWDCDSIKSCKAVLTIMGCLEYWQKVTNDIEQLGQVFQYLSASNNYRDIVGAYHHVLDKHLNGKKNKEAFRFINGRVQQHITCNFAKCKGYDRNQRDRGNEIAEKDEIDEYGEELVFIRDTLDTIHAYLVHGSDSGHRYSPSKHKPYKVHKRPMDDSSDDEKEPDKDTASYTLFDEEMAALKAWQKSIKKKGRTQTKNKFSTNIDALKQNGVDDDHISFDLLSISFKNNEPFTHWLKYMKDNECDSDVLLNNVHNINNNILYNDFKGDKKIVADVTSFIDEKQKAKQSSGNNTVQYGFGKRLYYWDYYKNNTDKDINQNTGVNYNPGYRYCDLYVSPHYQSFKNEVLSKDVSISKWNDISYKSQMAIKQSNTLKKIEAATDDRGNPLDLLERYNISKDGSLSLFHLQAVMFYTNLTSFCTYFGEAFRFLSPSENLKSLIKRNSKWYYLSRYLREVVECFGTRIDGKGPDERKQRRRQRSISLLEDVYNKRKDLSKSNILKKIKDIEGDTYYHGVSYLLFTEFSVNWYGPLSTSKQMEVATLFTNNTSSGLILELKEDWRYLRFFNVNLISCFGSEDERLFIGGYRSIQIASIRLLNDNINLQQIMHVLFVVNCLITGVGIPKNNTVSPADVSIFENLCVLSNALPIYAKQIWNKFRYKQKNIKIDIECMYGYYASFISLLCSSDPKLKNLLLMDKIAKVFPNVTEIICATTDCISGKYSNFQGEYSPAIVTSNFMLGVLSKLDKHAKLTKIVIQTFKHEIPDDCNLYPTQFGSLGWQVQRGSYKNNGYKEAKKNKQITLTKAPHGNIWDAIIKEGVIPCIASLIAGKTPYDSKLTSASCMPIFKKLIDGTKDVPADVQKQWDAFRHQQQCITINMEYMYKYYKAFMPLLTDINFKNLLLLDKIGQLFPSVTKITCALTDYKVKVNSKFISGVKNRLSKIPKHAKLTKIVIQTKEHEIADGCNLYVPQFGALGWQVQREAYKNNGWGAAKKNNQITLIKLGSDVIYKDVISKISSMIQGGSTLYKATSLDVPIFKKLIVGEKDIPADVQKQWDDFRKEQQRITINMKNMHQDFQGFMPLLCDPKIKNLLLLDKIVQLFPNVTEIICKNTDCVNGKYDKWGYFKGDYSADIVCANFMLSLKDCLSKINKQAKLIKIVTQTERKSIHDDCNLYAPQFETLGWKIGKGCNGNTIVLTKASYNVIYKGVLPKISAMIQGEKPSGDIPPSLDVPIFTKLIVGAKNIPADVQKQWDTFRHQQQSITIDMKEMYKYYKAFMPLLFDPKLKHLLLLDRIVQLFPNATEIICRGTDYIGLDKWGNRDYSADIVSSNFILGVKERLSKIDKQAKLTKIVIQTRRHEIAADCKLYAPQFGALGSQIGKGSKTIALTKNPYDFSKVSSMIRGLGPSYGTTPLDIPIPIFNKLTLGAKDIPADVQQMWNEFRYKQQKIEVNMEHMYKHYKAFIPLLFDPKCKNLLLLDKIVQLFPTVTQIICKRTDNITGGNWNKDCSAAIVCSNFILGVKERLSKMDKHAKLTKIVIQTKEHEIADGCNLYVPQFGALGWQLGKGCNGKTIVLTKESYDEMYKDVIPKIAAMVQEKELSDDIPLALDVPIFKQLIVGTKDIPADVQKQWDAFRHQQQRITIDIENMYGYFQAFMPLLFDRKLKNLLLLDKIVPLFPNVTEIICEATDYDGAKIDQYTGIREFSADIVCSNFILGVKERLSKLDKQAKLTNIVIQTWKYEVADDCNLYSTQFGALGWQVQRGSWVGKNYWGDKIKHENSQITLTRLKEPNTSFSNEPPALSDANGNKPNDHQVADNAVFDLD